MPLAIHRLHMGLPPLEMDVWWLWSVSCMNFFSSKLNMMVRVSIPDGHIQATVVLKNSPS